MPISETAVTAPLTSSLTISFNFLSVSGWPGSGTTVMTSKMYMAPLHGRSSPRISTVPTAMRSLRSCVISEISRLMVFMQRTTSVGSS